MKSIYLLIAVVLISLTGNGQTAKDFFDRGNTKLDSKDYEAAITGLMFRVCWQLLHQSKVF